MPSFSIIEYLYVTEYILPCFHACLIFPLIKHFTFYCTEKSFCVSVIITIPFPAHTAYHFVFLQKLLVITILFLKLSFQFCNSYFVRILSTLCFLIQFLSV
jgi:hypothetical protein